MSLSLLLPLVTAHLLGDFVFQTKRMVERKGRPGVLFLHALIHALLGYVFVGIPSAWLIPVAIFVTHPLIDFAKASTRSTGLLGFTLDQVAHLVVVIAIVAVYPALFGDADSIWTAPGLWTRILLLAAGGVATVRMGAFVVDLAVEPFLDQIELGNNQIRGLREGGRTIGQLERALIFIFVLINQFTAIGFLIAAKSIFRFGELRERDNRMEAEYIIIGTLISFLWAIVIALVIRQFL